jgi:type III restriction enzyme
VPNEIAIFSDYAEYPASHKSIIKENSSHHFFVKKNKNGKIEFSGPEEKFITGLENTDDEVLWWFKNGAGESKYFGIAYKKQDNHYYAFYPDFLIKTKKETLIVEIKDDNDFKSENALKLQAGKDYIKRAENKEPVRFYILSPQDYARFFQSIQDQELDGFSSFYERNLLHYSASQKVILNDKGVENEKEKEELVWLSELEKTISELDDEKERNELLKLDLAKSKAIIEQLRQKPFHVTAAQPLNIQKPFNMCILGEVSREQEIREQLNKYFQKHGLSAVDWNIEFFNNSSLQRKNILRSLIKGQSKYNLALTGQIHHHSGKSNASANLLTELKDGKYIPHIIACSPQDVLTCTVLIAVLDKYLNDNTLCRSDTEGGGGCMGLKEAL